MAALNDPRSRAHTVLLACAGAVAVRAFMFWFVDARFDTGDGSSYLQSARTLLQEGTFSYDSVAPFTPSAYRPPLFPVYLAGLLAVTRDHLMAARVLHMLVSVLNVVLVSTLTSRLNPQSRKAAVWLTALNPFDAVFGVVFLSESIGSTILLAALTAFVRFKGLAAVIVGGVLLGLLCLLKDVFIPMVPLAAITWVVAQRGIELKMRLRQAVIVCLVSGAVVVPWTIRNAHHFGKFIPVSAGRLGLSLWMGSWAVSGNDLAVPDNGLHYLPQAYRTEAEVAQVEAALNANPIDDTAFRALFDARMRSEPLKVLGKWFARAPLLWLGTRFDIFELHKTALPMRSPQWFALKTCLFGLNALLLVAALIGAVWAFTRESPLRWLSIPIIGTALVFFPLNGFENRYSMPVYDLVLIFAAAGLVWLRERFRARALVE